VEPRIERQTEKKVNRHLKGGKERKNGKEEKKKLLQRDVADGFQRPLGIQHERLANQKITKTQGKHEGDIE